MQVAFRKMHGAGNDFVVVDDRAGTLGLTSGQVAALADRRTGIGCDQFITLEPVPPGSPGTDVFMRIHNPDGSEAGACGNATRCVAALLFEQTGQPRQVIQTVAGNLPATCHAPDWVTVDMGPARTAWQDVPLSRPADTLHLPLPGDPAALSMGNPHATFFVHDLDSHPIEADGSRFEHDPLFPQRANIGFAQVLGPSRIRLRVWERGAGLTLACGSGACAALVNAFRRGLTGRRAELVLDGGVLQIEYTDDGRVLMTGPAATSFQGSFIL